MTKKLKLMGRKIGMTQTFDEEGRSFPCTVIQTQPNVIIQIKNLETDGYNAIQTGYEEVTAKDPRRQDARCKKPQRDLYKKLNIAARKNQIETRVDSTSEFEVGQEYGAESYTDIKYVDVTATSKGKGYAGVIKKHNFSGGPAAHGSGFHRHAGSTGMRSTPGRCLPGGPRPSQMGNKRVTAENLKIIEIDAENQLIVVKGAVPGPRNGLVTIRQAIKRGGA